MNHIIIYSHGFGVKKDDRGLFTDIATALPNIEHVMFDYNQSDDTSNTLTVTPLDKQVEMLADKVAETQAQHPNAIIDLVCHSQGCVVAALAKLADIRKTIFLAPPAAIMNAEQKIRRMSERQGTIVEKDGEIRYPRRDGSTTIVNADYWKSYDGLQPIKLYKDLAATTQLIIIKANQDEVIGRTDFSELADEAETLELDANHDFTGAARLRVQQLIKQKV